ncbi:MAG: hypothetical protein ACR65R_06870 [Methylomicrobium sp.]
MAITFLSRSRAQTAIALLMVLLGQGCTEPMVRFDSLEHDQAACLAWYRKLDTLLDEHELVGRSAAKIPGFPYLRADRFLASFRLQPLNESAYMDWLERMQQLDRSLRLKEIANLPPADAKAVLAEAPMPDSVGEVLQQCGSRLVQAALQRPETRPFLRQHVRAPDIYQSWQRIIGAYWLMQYPANLMLERLHEKLAASFAQPLDQLPVHGRLIRYALPSGGVMTSAEIKGMLRAAYQNPMAIPTLSEENLERLFDHFAPVWEIDTRNDSDKIGAVYLAEQGRPRVDIRHPVVYRKHAYTRWQGRILLQLIYQIWLPAREKTGLIDVYGGDLDSMIWRVTLSPEGVPIGYDSIHACGCYHLLFPGPGYRSISPRDDAADVLSPKHIGSIQPGQRLLLRIEARTHHLQQTAVINESDRIPATLYQIKPYESLLSLPLPDGSNHSLFGQDGLIAASARLERFLLWPYGVPSAGAMREWGIQAIALTGKRYFDEPFLLENLMASE